MKRIVAIFVLLISSVIVRAADRPNVLIIAVDDLRAWVGCLGGLGVHAHTPNIDRLAARGVLFTRAYTAAPLCNPSRTAFFTGLRPSTTGVYTNDQWWRPALPHVMTMPERFMQAGYRVEGAGKLFHHMPGSNPPSQWYAYFTQVFDDPYHRPSGKQIDPVVGTHWPPGFPLNGLGDVIAQQKPPFNPREFDWGALPKSDEQMGDGQMATWVAGELSKRWDRPLFMAAGTFKPHMPWYAPRKYFDLFDMDKIELPPLKENDLDDVPPIGRSWAHVSTEYEVIKKIGGRKRAIHAYLAATAFADACVGRILDGLDANPALAHNIVIVLWSDHGWHHGEKDHWLKSTLWEEATHVPLIIAGPGIKPARCDRVVSLIDVYPTIAELCGLPLPGADGVSLAPLLRDPTQPWARPALMTYQRGNHAVRDERWRYIRYRDGTEELYDHNTDEYEWTNLANRSEYTALKQRLAAAMPSYDAPDAPPKSAYEFDIEHYTWKKRP
jgi:arylsulfatase A-like enzyme